MKLLILTSRFPFPLNKGDKLRAYHQIKELSKKNNICLISLTEKEIAKEELNEKILLRNSCIQIEQVENLLEFDCRFI